MAAGCNSPPASLFGGAMIRISLAYLYETGANVGKLIDATNKTGTLKLTDIWHPVGEVHDRIVQVYNNSFYKDSLNVSRPLAFELASKCVPFRQRTDFEADMGFFEIWELNNAARKFDDILKAELAVIDAYFVTKKGGYDTLALVTNAAVLFPQSLRVRAPEAVDDILEAGKCLAFELGTSAGFHTLRACESVLRRYWDHVTSGTPRPKNRNIGAYLKKMEDLGVGDKKVLAVLTQIKDLHRNALIHPEESLTLDEAINLMGIVRSAVSAMLAPLPDVPSPPAAVPAALPASAATPTPSVYS